MRRTIGSGAEARKYVRATRPRGAGKRSLVSPTTFSINFFQKPKNYAIVPWPSEKGRPSQDGFRQGEEWKGKIHSIDTFTTLPRTTGDAS